MAAHVLTTPVTEHTMSAGDPTVTHPSSGGTEDSMLSPSELSTQGRASTLGRAKMHASPPSTGFDDFNRSMWSC